MLHLKHARIWPPEPNHALFLRWVVLAGLIAFGGWIAWDQQILQRLLLSDPTRISLLIMIVFIAGSAHCAFRSLYLSKQQQALETIIAMAEHEPPQVRDGRLLVGTQPLPHSLPEAYLSGAVTKRIGTPASASAPDNQLAAQVMAERARGQHEAGWFIAGSLIKLGLLGTVIGFVLMLAPVTSLESFDQSQVQNLLRQMTVGMGVALNTTLVGLVCTMLLGIQYLLVDRAADRLVAQTVDFTDAFLSSWSMDGR